LVAPLTARHWQEAQPILHTKTIDPTLLSILRSHNIMDLAKRSISNVHIIQSYFDDWIIMMDQMNVRLVIG